MPASSANDDDSRAELAVQRTALEGILARYGLRLEPSFGEAPAEARDSSPHGASLLRAKLLASEGARTVEVLPARTLAHRQARARRCLLRAAETYPNPNPAPPAPQPDKP